MHYIRYQNNFQNSPFCGKGGKYYAIFIWSISSYRINIQKKKRRRCRNLLVSSSCFQSPTAQNSTSFHALAHSELCRCNRTKKDSIHITSVTLFTTLEKRLRNSVLLCPFRLPSAHFYRNCKDPVMSMLNRQM